MTRSSLGPVRMMRHTQSRKSGPGGHYPQWMKTLEEKYQKLHKKIAENTGFGSGGGSFTHAIGRSVYDSRLSHSGIKFREYTPVRLSVRQHNALPRRSESALSGPVNTHDKERIYTEGNDDKENANNQCLENSDMNISDRKLIVKHLQKSEQSESGSEVQDENVEQEAENHLTSARSNTDSCNECEPEEGSAKLNDAGDNESDKLDKGDSAGACLELVDTHRTHLDTERDAGDKGYSRHNLKTSLSRTSKVTTKSCPAKIQTQSAKNIRERVALTRSKSTHKHIKMFTPMSAEAKHAISETIQEMHVSTPSNGKKANFVPSRNRTCIKSWTGVKHDNGKRKVNHKSVQEPISNRLNEFNDEGVVSTKHQEVTSERSSHANSPKLPDIQQELSVKDRNGQASHSYRIPGIGKYNIAQNDTFEITPPGFDSRYKDVQPVEERESETPPPDIRQQAIEKCSEWLIKHNK